MPKVSQITFNGGEYTEFMAPRVDVAKYGKGCRTMENFEATPFGTALCRPGTVHGGAAKFADRQCRLHPFVFSTTTTFDIEVGHLYMRFWKDQQRVGGGTPYEIVSPYSEGEVFQVQFEQIDDILYLTHPNHPDQKMVRLADNLWILSKIDYTAEGNYPPLAPRNIDDTKTIAVGAGFDTVGSSVSLTTTVDVFTTDQVGDAMMIGHFRDDTELKQDITGNVVSSVVYVLGDWAFQTGGIGVYKVTFEESVDQTNWVTKRSYEINGAQRNILTSGSEATPKFFRINVTNYVSHDSGNVPFAIIEASDPFVPGLVKITAVTDEQNATADVIEPLHSGDATKEWEEQFFSARRGYPRAICVHRNRRCLGLRDIALSQPGGYENYRRRNDADSGFIIPIRRSGSPFIQWMEDLRELRFGTNQAEGVIVPENTTEAFAYNNFYVRWDSNYGSKHLRAQAANGTALFLQPEGRTLRYQLLTGVENYYDANTITALADHILGLSVVQTGYQRQRYPTWHGVRDDGQVASLLYEESQNVQSWYRMVTDGAIESISVTPRSDEEDRVAYAVKRTVDGADVRHIEFRALGQYRVLQDRELSDMWFVDDGIEVDISSAILVPTPEGPRPQVTGLDHLEGVSVAILVDGASIPERTVTGGALTIDYAGTKAIIGRPYDMTLIPMFLESQGIMGQSKSISSAIIRLWRSGTSRMRINTGRWSKLVSPPEFLGQAPPLEDGDSDKVTVDSDWSRNTAIELRGRSPLPLNVQAITLEFEIGKG